MSTCIRNQSKKITSRKQTSLASDNENIGSRFWQEEREMENPDSALERHPSAELQANGQIEPALHKTLTQTTSSNRDNTGN
jgi:hypothetical protein